MNQISDILGFHFSVTDFKNRSTKIIPITLQSQLELRIGELSLVRETIGNSSFQFNEEKLIPGIFRKFKYSIRSNNTNFDTRELRTLTYSLSYTEDNIPSIFSNENELSFALHLLNSKWKDSYLMGLIDCFMNNWDTKHRNSLEQIEQFGARKLDTYNGNRSTLICFKKNKRFFSTKNGDLIFGDAICKLNKPIQEATKMLGVPESWFVYPYFSKVIVTYYERSKGKIIDEIDNLNDAIQKHKSSITNKRLISKIIIQANQTQFAAIQDKIKKIAFTEIGDPSNSSNWAAFDNAPDTEKSEVLQARNILNEWIAKQFIDVFFKVCINDERRKRFWLNIASKTKLTFKVYGPLPPKPY
jgi:hypothetical protein